MKTLLKRLSALISLSLASNAKAVVPTDEKAVYALDIDVLAPADLNTSISPQLATHRSHRSHSSHRSHRSSSGGSSYQAPSYSAPTPSPSYTTPPPQPKYTPSPRAPIIQSNPSPAPETVPEATYLTPSTRPQPGSTPSYRRSDPLGQQPRPEGSYPSTPSRPNLAEMLGNKAMLKNIVMRMQLTLQFEGYYHGNIDGIMGPGTRAAVKAYKRDHDLPGTAVFDAPTLNALGIRGY